MACNHCFGPLGWASGLVLDIPALGPVPSVGMAAVLAADKGGEYGLGVPYQHYIVCS